MVDPVTAIAGATAAYNGLKKMIAVGKDIHDMGSTLSQWAGAMSDLDFAHGKAENPPMFKKIFGASAVEQTALETWGHKQKAKEMREELRSHISLFYGPSAWDEIVRIEAQMRKERREAVYKKEERKQLIIEWVAGIFLALMALATIGGIIWLTGFTKGWW